MIKFPYGLASAGNIYIGQLLGGNQPKKAKNATKVLFSISSLFTKYKQVKLI